MLGNLQLALEMKLSARLHSYQSELLLATSEVRPSNWLHASLLGLEVIKVMLPLPGLVTKITIADLKI